MRLCSLASGSSGNCTFIGSSHANILVDAGISGKRIEYGLNCIEIKPADLEGILITHEHSDHIQGIGVLARRYHTPIYGTRETLQAISRMKSMGEIPAELFRPVLPDEGFYINDIYVEPFHTSHDAVNPVCYTFASEGHKVGMATDLGVYNDYIISKLADSEILLLEANHDENMLLAGAYPYHLKQRILGDRGHLSNENSARLIGSILHEKVRYITLAHLSKENNFEDLAYETVRLELNNVIQKNAFSLKVDRLLSVAKRDLPSEMLCTG